MRTASLFYFLLANQVMQFQPAVNSKEGRFQKSFSASLMVVKSKFRKRQIYRKLEKFVKKPEAIKLLLHYIQEKMDNSEEFDVLLDYYVKHLGSSEKVIKAQSVEREERLKRVKTFVDRFARWCQTKMKELDEIEVTVETYLKSRNHRVAWNFQIMRNRCLVNF